MKVNDNQKVAIYASALQGTMAADAKGEYSISSLVKTSIEYADEMIKQLEERKEDNYNPAD